MSKLKNLVGTALLTVALVTCVPASAEQEVGRVQIARSYTAANGCHEETQTFTASIANPDKLDRSYQGVLAGIEVVEWTGVNGHDFRNFAFINNGAAISFQLHAKGSGNWIDPPLGIGGGWCAGAAGGSEGVEVFAHYK